MMVVEAQENQTACGGSLTCFNNGICKQGEAQWPGDESADTSGEGDGLPSSLDETNQGGYYCDCVPDAVTGEHFTGLSCDIPYRECQYPNGFTVCYHYGSCLDDAPESWDPKTPVCNCETANHKGFTYVGRNCEVLSHEADPCEGQESYCLHGGICRAPENNSTEQPSDNDYCACPSGFDGPKCENKVQVEQDGPCDLECQNGGSCQFVAETNEADGTISTNAKWGSHKNMFCDCPTNFAGIHCEHMADICGDQELICLHGSTCQAKREGGYECKCAESYQGGVCDARSRVQHCNPVGGIEFAFGMAVPAFCANGGTCTERVVDGYL